jgi:preprotein translocase subunit SecA
MGRGQMAETFATCVRTLYEEKERQIGPEAMLYHERMIMLQIVDAQWKDHLYALDHLKEGIGLRGYGQRDPLVEYKKESYNMFQALMDRIDEEILRWVFLAQPVPPGPQGGEGGPTPDDEMPGVRRRPGGGGKLDGAAVPEPRRLREPELALAGARPMPKNLTFNDPGELLSGSRSALGAAAAPKEAQGGTDEVQTVRRDTPKVGRNDPCPCGSGKKYKKCHGA